jgi:hypothetical protein
VQRTLALPDVEVHAEPIEAGLDALADAARRPVPYDGVGVRAIGVRRRPDVVRQ